MIQFAQANYQLTEIAKNVQEIILKEIVRVDSIENAISECQNSA